MKVKNIEEIIKIEDIAFDNYVEGIKKGYDIAVTSLEKQIEIQTSGIGTSDIWANWLKYNKDKLINNMDV